MTFTYHFAARTAHSNANRQPLKRTKNQHRQKSFSISPYRQQGKNGPQALLPSPTTQSQTSPSRPLILTTVTKRHLPRTAQRQAPRMRQIWKTTSNQNAQALLAAIHLKPQGQRHLMSTSHRSKMKQRAILPPLLHCRRTPATPPSATRLQFTIGTSKTLASVKNFKLH